MCRCWRTARRPRSDHRRRRWRRAEARAAAPHGGARGDGGDRRRGDPAGTAVPARHRRRRLERSARRGDRGRWHRLCEACAGCRVRCRSSSIPPIRSAWARCCSPTISMTTRPVSWRRAGLVVNQCGVPFMQADELRDTSARRARYFRACRRLCRRGADLCRRLHDARLRRQGGGCGCGAGGRYPSPCRAAGILGTTRYWTPELHVGGISISALYRPPSAAAGLSTATPRRFAQANQNWPFDSLRPSVRPINAPRSAATAPLSRTLTVHRAVAIQT